MLDSDSKYPAVVKALQGAGKYFTAMSSSKEVTQAALDRIRDVCCNVLDQAQRDRLIAWIELLLDPASRKTARPDAQADGGQFRSIEGFPDSSARHREETVRQREGLALDSDGRA